jgi:hypothetical protein
MEIEHLEKRFGVTAVEKGFVTPQQVIAAMKIQVLEDCDTGKHRLIGRILLEEGHLTLDQVEEVLSTLKKRLPLLREMEGS